MVSVQWRAEQPADVMSFIKAQRYESSCIKEDWKTKVVKMFGVCYDPSFAVA